MLKIIFGGSGSFALLLSGVILSSALAAPDDSQANRFPPDDDPSAYTGPFFGDLPDDLPDANEGAFEGGETGSGEDAAVENVLPAADQRDDGSFNVPTNGPPSPLFGAQPFTQRMLRFEEFGLEPLAFGATKQPADWRSMPMPADAQSVPRKKKLEAFLGQSIWPIPTKFANDWDLNPWQPAIESFLGRDLDMPPAEGRPPGQGWAHQRWKAFKPEVYFQTAQTGARRNGGFRDDKQLHDYHFGEFGPGGLYHKTSGHPRFAGTTEGIKVRFHRNMPIQEPNTLWTFDGTFPPKLLMARYGAPVGLPPLQRPCPSTFRRQPRLRSAHPRHPRAQRPHPVRERRLHATRSSSRVSTTTTAGRCSLAGHDSINTEAERSPRRRAGRRNGGIIAIPGDWRETMSTHWFHDHMLDFTAQNVYKGNAAMMNYYSALDRGNEGHRRRHQPALARAARHWTGANRDYDVQLLIADKAWDQEGQLWFNPLQPGRVSSAT